MKAIARAFVDEHFAHVYYLIGWLFLLVGLITTVHAQDIPPPCRCSNIGYVWASPTVTTSQVWVWMKGTKPVAEFASKPDLVYAERGQKAADLVRRINEAKALTPLLAIEAGAFLSELGTALK